MAPFFIFFVFLIVISKLVRIFAKTKAKNYEENVSIYTYAILSFCHGTEDENGGRRIYLLCS